MSFAATTHATDTRRDPVGQPSTAPAPARNPGPSSGPGHFWRDRGNGPGFAMSVRHAPRSPVRLLQRRGMFRHHLRAMWQPPVPGPCPAARSSLRRVRIRLHDATRRTGRPAVVLGSVHCGLAVLPVHRGRFAQRAHPARDRHDRVHRGVRRQGWPRAVSRQRAPALSRRARRLALSPPSATRPRPERVERPAETPARTPARAPAETPARAPARTPARAPDRPRPALRRLPLTRLTRPSVDQAPDADSAIASMGGSDTDSTAGSAVDGTSGSECPAPAPSPASAATPESAWRKRRLASTMRW